MFPVSNFTPLSYLLLRALVHLQKPSSVWPLCHSILFARACSCHTSCTHPSRSLPEYVATLPPVPSLGMVKEASYTALATGSLKQVTSQSPGPCWDLPGAWQAWQKNCYMYFFQTSTHSLCTHQCSFSLTSHLEVVREQLLSAFLPFSAPDCSAYKLAGTGVVSHHFLVMGNKLWHKGTLISTDLSPAVPIAN